MLADFNISSLSNVMKIGVQKNNLGGQIWYRSLEPVKKRRLSAFKIFDTIVISIVIIIWTIVIVISIQL